MVELPRVEAEFSYSCKFGENSNFKLFVNGAAQTAKDGVERHHHESQLRRGGSAGIVIDVSGFALTGSRLITARAWAHLLFLGDGIRLTVGADGDGVDVAGKAAIVRLHRPGHYSPANSKFRHRRQLR